MAPPPPAAGAPRLRAWAWVCSNGSQVTTRLVADPPAVLLPLDGRTLSLLQRVSASGVRYEARAAGHHIRIAIGRHPCRDDMSGEPFLATVRLEVDGRVSHGCGQPLAH